MASTPTKTPVDSLQLLFPTVLQISQASEHDQLKATLLETIQAERRTQPNSKPQSWACDLYTTIGAPRSLLQNPALKDFFAVLQAKVLAYARAMEYDVENQPPRIHECWLNVYGTGHAQEIHLHRNSVFSGIYFVQAPTGSGATLFYSPTADSMLEPRVSKGNRMNAKVTGIEAKEGQIILFRSSLRHSVLPGTFDGERITVAFNAVM